MKTTGRRSHFCTLQWPVMILTSKNVLNVLTQESRIIHNEGQWIYNTKQLSEIQNEQDLPLYAMQSNFPCSAPVYPGTIGTSYMVPYNVPIWPSLYIIGYHIWSNGRSNPEVVGSIPTEVKSFFFTSCGSLIPFTRANAQWVIHGFN